MDIDLRNYLHVYRDWFDKDRCAKIIKESSSLDWKQHTFYSPTLNKDVGGMSGDNEPATAGGEIASTEYLMDRVWQGFHTYIQNLQMPWICGWSGFEAIKYIRYEEGQTMALHCDRIKSMFDGERKGDPTITAIGVLNDDYEGGEFIMWNQKIDTKAGDLLMFPSNFLYPHKIEPIKRGARYSIATWAW